MSHTRVRVLVPRHYEPNRALLARAGTDKTFLSFAWWGVWGKELRTATSNVEQNNKTNNKRQKVHMNMWNKAGICAVLPTKTQGLWGYIFITLWRCICRVCLKSLLLDWDYWSAINRLGEADRHPSPNLLITDEPRTILRRVRGKVKTLPCSSDACQLKQQLLAPPQVTQPEKNPTRPLCAPHIQFLVCHGKRGHKHLGSTFPSRSRRFVVSAPTKDETTSGTYHVSVHTPLIQITQQSKSLILPLPLKSSTLTCNTDSDVECSEFS